RIAAGDRAHSRARVLPDLRRRSRRRLAAMDVVRDLRGPGTDHRAGPRTVHRGPGDHVVSGEARLVEVRRHILKDHDVRARALRERWRAEGVFVVSIVSSPGSGKTMLLERTLTELGRQARVAALVGDLATDNDAARLSRSRAPVRQITTGTVCHLDAAMV